METICQAAGQESLKQAAALLQTGQVVAFPTETVYGLGANALDENAVRAIFAAKERPADNPLIVHVADKSGLKDLCEVTETAEKLMDAFWPGPLTLLLKKTQKVPAVTTAGLDTVAVRCPNHPVALQLIRESGLPIAAPSANRSGRPSPTSAAHVYEDMQGRIPMILDGGNCQVGVESTVLDVSGDIPCVLRPGAITREMIARVAGDCTLAPSIMRPLQAGEHAPSPGMKHRHYAPKAKMTVFVGKDEDVIREMAKRYDAMENSWILAHTHCLPAFGQRRCLALGDTPGEGAHLLFQRLRELDEKGAAFILAQGWEAEGEALAVMNRMARAAAFDILHI